MCISYEYSIWGLSCIHINRRRMVSRVAFLSMSLTLVRFEMALSTRSVFIAFLLAFYSYWTFSIIFILVTTDVVGDNWCDRFGLWPFRSVAVSVCGRSGLWPFLFVAVPVCGRSGLWPFRSVAVSVCGRFGCGRFGLWPLWPVTWQFTCDSNVRLDHGEGSEVTQPIYSVRKYPPLLGLLIHHCPVQNHIHFRKKCDHISTV